MQQRQLRLGDILDDYCPRERRVTNHAVVAMVGPEVKQTRCTTCEADHPYKHAKIPRQRKKADLTAAALAQTPGGGPKRVVHEPAEELPQTPQTLGELVEASETAPERAAAAARTEEAALNQDEHDDDTEVGAGAAADDQGEEEGPVHRPLIRATLPRPEGQPPPQRPVPDFTIRQPGRANRFRPNNQRGGPQFGGGNRSNANMGGYGSQGSQGSRGNFGPRGSNRSQGPQGPQGPRGPHGAMTSRPARRHDRKRPK